MNYQIKPPKAITRQVMIILVKVAGIIFKTKIVNLAVIAPIIKLLLITFANNLTAANSVNWCSSREVANKQHTVWLL